MVDSPDTERVERTPPVRPRLIPLVATVVFAIGGLALLPAPAPSPAAVPSEESLPNPDSLIVDVASAEEVAESFMEAWVRGDGEAAASLFKPGAKFHGYEPEMFPALHQWYRAVGQEYRGPGCELVGAYNTVVSCDYRYYNKLTRTQGVESITGRHMVFVEDGAISGVIELTFGFAYADFLGFADWVSSNHPDDFELMFRFSPNPNPLAAPNTNYPLLDPTSITLWEQYSDEFVSTRGGEDAYLGQVRKICTAAHTRLNEELQAAGIEMQIPNGPDVDRLNLMPTSEAGWAAYEAAARRIMSETVPDLRVLPQPSMIKEKFDHLFGLMDEFARGEEAPFTPTPEFWIHQVDLEPSRSLSHCTFSLGA